MVTLDGVMQAPGGPDEDTSGGFEYGGWTAPYVDDEGDLGMAKDMQPAEYLLGRRTFEIFAGYWPQHASDWPGINDGMKYVMSTSLEHSDWANTTFVKTVADIEELKNTDGLDIQVWGSSNLIQTLLENDLIDEFRLKIFPLTLGQGKKLFDKGTMATAYKLVESSTTPSGVIMATYQRAGAVKTGTVGE